MTVPYQSEFRLFATSTATQSRLGDIPFSHLSFTRPINTAGRLEVRIQLNDPRIGRSGLDLALITARLRTVLWVEFRGTLIWGGFVMDHRYDRASGTLEITANTWSQYFTKRFQAQDYSYTWLAPADPMAIATRIVKDAMVLPYSALNWENQATFGVPFYVQQIGTTPLINWITASYPSIQLQTVGMIISTLTEMGYTVGFDYADLPLVVSGDAAGALWQIANPFIGWSSPQITSSTPVLDVARTTNLQVSAAGSETANSIVEMSTAAGSVMVFNAWQPSINENGLWQKIEMHPDVNSTPIVQVTLGAMAQTDLVLSAYGRVRVEATLSVSDPVLPLDVWQPGQVLILRNEGNNAVGGPDPFLPPGYSGAWRVIQALTRVPPDGVATTRFTLNVLPASTPAPAGI